MPTTNPNDIRRKAAPETLARAERKTEAMMAAMELEGLRRARKIRHDELEMRIARQVRSAEPSPTEMRVGALRDVVEAMGGELRMTAYFPDAEYQIDPFRDGGESP